MATLPRGIKLYRKLRYRKGHGVHSPFVYNLITKVIEEKTPYYAFDEIEKVRQTLLSEDNPLYIIPTQHTQHRNYGALLFRLVNFFKCKCVLQIGGSTGIMSLYLAMASRNACQCIVVEENPVLLKKSCILAEESSLNNLRFVEGDYIVQLKKIFFSVSNIDLIFINSQQDASLVEKIAQECLSNINKNTVLVLDGIEKNRSMRELWERVKNHSKTSVSINLHALGIVFFDDKLHKQHYQTYFDYGKKQNIYKNRRQRFYFPGRRKKSSQNTSKD